MFLVDWLLASYSWQGAPYDDGVWNTTTYISRDMTQLLPMPGQLGHWSSQMMDIIIITKLNKITVSCIAPYTTDTRYIRLAGNRTTELQQTGTIESCSITLARSATWHQTGNLANWTNTDRMGLTRLAFLFLRLKISAKSFLLSVPLTRRRGRLEKL